MYYVYVIENVTTGGWYIGFTTDVDTRVSEHNHKKSPYTKRVGGTWQLIYYEFYKDKMDALGRETFLKSGSGRNFLKKQIRNYLLNRPK